MIQGLSADFAAEIKTKQDNLDVTQAHLRAATRELSEQRKQIQVWQARCSELDQVTQRIRNVEHALVDEERFDWTGRTEFDGRDAPESASPAFRRRGQNSTMAGLGGLVDVSFNFDAEPVLPAGDSPASLVRLRRMKMWHVRMEALVHQRLESLRGASAEREFQCKKIVALCTGAPIDKVEEVLELSFPGSLIFCVCVWLTSFFWVRCLMIWSSPWRAKHKLLISGGSRVLCRR
jgi:regulatory protein SWI6